MIQEYKYKDTNTAKTYAACTCQLPGPPDNYHLVLLNCVCVSVHMCIRAYVYPCICVHVFLLLTWCMVYGSDCCHGEGQGKIGSPGEEGA